MVSWLKKNGDCWCWPNGDAAENVAMGAAVFNDLIERVAKEEKVTPEDAWDMILSVVNKAE